ncbi:hypothetical protein QR680_009902 [Steinernema hermaphroditum]|uniref:Uncharacterized protein n=1 Tax=Steinernema hermaphroditum TaxID=289476 RepID=A0AA39IPI9_9BILA|nr:hypothetical protein QR680_009902 [Steinernema hermaphroditum]
MTDRDRPSRLRPNIESQITQRPTWSITRRERTEVSPLRVSTGTDDNVFRSRTITTTERVQIMQMPLDLSSGDETDVILALSPTGNASRSVQSTTTLIEPGPVPVIGGLTADGVPLFNGIYMNTDAKQTTTIITTTTTTYKILSDSDSSRDLTPEANTTIDLDLEKRIKLDDETLYLVVGKRETENDLVETVKLSSPRSTTSRSTAMNGNLDEDVYLISDESEGDDRPKRNVFKRSFRRSTRSSDYPSSEPYKGAVASTSRTEELVGAPLETAIFDRSGNIVGQVVRKKKAFKRGIAHQDYPISAKYTGHIATTAKQRELIHHPAPTVGERIARQSGITSDESLRKEKRPSVGKQFAGLFKKTISYPEYPTSQPYKGPLEEIGRSAEVEGDPLEHHITVYHSTKGSQSTKHGHDPKLEASSGSRFKSLFRRDDSRQRRESSGFKTTQRRSIDYPVSSTYEGLVDETGRHRDIDGEPLDHHVSVYHSGRSDEAVPKQPEHPTLEEKERGPGFGGIFTGLFKKGPAHLDYPVSSTYEGLVDETGRHRDIDGEPLDHHVSVYHSGRSDEAMPKVVEHPTVEEKERGPGFGGIFTGLFKKGPAHLDYPVSSTYEGLVDETGRHRDIDGEPLDHHVSVYHSGRSDEAVPKQPEHPTVEEKERGPGFGGIFTGLFKKGPAHLDYPVSSTYEGLVDETGRHRDIDGEPLDHHVSVYHSGRSDEAVPKQPEHPTVEEKERGPGFGGIFTGLFKKGPAHLDYPVSSTYEGLVDETGRHRDIDGEPLDHHVSVYHSGRSDEAMPKVVEHPILEEKERGPGFGGIFTGLFKKGPAHLDYPVSSTYEGLVDETGRHRDIDGEPLDHHVFVYHSGRSDEAVPKQPEHPTVEEKERGPGFGGIFTGLFKKGPAHLDYPVSSTYEGLVDETGRHRDIDGEPLDHHVSVYHSGRSDEAVPKQPEHPTVEEKERGPGFGGIFTGLFKKGPAHLDYPVSSTYEGLVDETGRHRDIDGEPLDHHVFVYHSGRSDEAVPKQPEHPTVEEKERGPGFGGIFTGLFKKGPAHLDYPVSSTYEGLVDETGRHRDIDGEPLDHHVSVYHSGRSDEAMPKVVEHPILEEKERGPGFGGIFTGLFKKGPAHLDYPVSSTYEGLVDETGRHRDIDGEPLDHHVSVYHSGRSDEAMPKVVEHPTVEEKERGPGFGGIFTGLFKKGPAHLDYPVSSTYEGLVDETGRHRDIDGEPLDHHVSVYHSGRSDEAMPKVVEHPTVEERERGPGFGGIFTGLFKKGPAHLDYPVSSTYEGLVDETGRHRDIDGEPLDHHVSVYHSGRSDEAVPKQPEHPTLEKKEGGPGLGGIFTGLLKRGPVLFYFLFSPPYEGLVDETGRHRDIDGEPLDHHVSVYHSGRSDEAVPKQPEHPTVEEKERGPGFGGIFTGLFKKGPAHLDYPVSSTYEGLVDETGRHRDIDGEPLDHHVSVYHSGRSDEAVPKVVEHPTVEEKERGPGFGGIFTGLFKKGPAHLDYPVSSTYEGLVDETGRHRDIDGEPLDHHVSVYHSGRSDEAVPKVVEHPTVEEKERGPGFGGIFTGLFKKGPAHLDYPVSSTYEGLVDETGRHRDIDGEPLDHHVSVYHSGRSDEAVPKVVEHPTVEEKERGPGFGGIFTGLFKKGPAHLDYPVSSTYEGLVDETGRHRDIDGEPLDHHVSVYHSGRSDEAVPKVVEHPTVEEKERGPGFGGIFTGLFKKGPAHLDYPVSSTYEGLVDETGRHRDIDGEPLDHHVSVYHSGRSDEAMPKVVEHPTVEEKERGPGFGGIFTGLFKKGPAHLDYPVSSTYEGLVDETGRHRDIDGEPLDHHVSVYHSGRSDEAMPKVVEHPTVEEKERGPGFGGIFTGLFKKGPAHLDYPVSSTYEGLVDETGRHRDIDGEPLDHHVSVYHSGRSDEAMPKVVEHPTVEEKERGPGFGGIFTGLFKKGPAHLDYPVSSTYEGLVDETGRHHDIDGEPLDHHVSVYHSGRSDEAVPKVIEHPTVEEKERGPGFGGIFTGLFKKGPAHLDYPVSSTYEGLVDETGRHRDIDGEPLDHHVSVYHSGRSDEAMPKVVEHPTVEEKERGPGLGGIFTGLFKKGPAHLDYPVSSTYEGLVDETGRHRDIDGEPLDHHVSVYHSGRSDEAMPKVVEHPTVEEKERGPGFGGIFTGLFKKGPAHLDYPVSSTYEGLVDETGRHRDIDGEPLDHHVSVYHSGRSDEAERGPGFGGIFTGLFKKGPAHLDYPVSSTYEGLVDETGRHRDIDGEPLDHHVSVYHSGRSDEAVPKVVEHPTVEEKERGPGFGGIFTGLFKKGPAHLDYPVSSTYEGLVDETGRHQHPTVEEKERGPGFGGIFTGLFKKGPAHLDYPVSSTYEGLVDETGRHRDIDGEPLDHHVSVYHSGRSDEAVPKVVEHPTVEEKERGPGFGGIFTGLFKKGPAHLDYPVSSTYEGLVDETGRHRDIDGEPLDHHVSVYHSGRSDEAGPKQPEHPTVEEKERGPGFGGIFTGLFKKGPAHLDYPVSSTYEGLVDETGRHRDIDGEPLDHHVSVYHSGRSDEAGGIFTGLFKKGPAHLDYPVSSTYEGLVDETGRHRDIDGEPLDHHVSVYHSGRSDEAGPKQPEHPTVEEKERGPGFGGIFTGLFKKGPAHLDYPVSSTYEGLVDETGRHRDIDGEPLDHHVSVYHSGRSDEAVPKQPEHPTVEEKERGPGFGGIFTGLFKKGPAHLDYPVSSTYEGLVDETGRHRDIDGEPLDHHVSVYHSGRSDEAVPKVIEHPTVEEKERGPGFGGIFTGLFKKGPAHLDYPVSSTYEGLVDETGRHRDIDGEPLDHHVSVYHSGRSDEAVPKQPEHPTVEEKERGPGFGGIFTGLFKKGPAHLDYPVSSTYEGLVDETGRHRDIDGEPLDHHVSVYHSGRSDEAVPKQPEHPTVEEKERGPGFGGIFTGLFKKGPAHLDYPVSSTYEGLVDETGRHRDIDGEPLDHHVSVYHSGRSDEAVPKVIEHPTVEEKERGPGFGGIFTGLFKKGPAHLDYPVSSTYEGLVDETGRHRDIDGEPLDHHVSVYHSGRSDEAVPKVVEHPTVEEKERGPGFGGIFTGLFKKGPAHLDYPVSSTYEGLVDETGRHRDIDGEPLDHHVSVYHSGRSDEAVPKQPEHPTVEEKERGPGFGGIFTGLFKKGPAHLDYPVSSTYEGLVDETGRHRDIDGEPLDHHVSVYHSGRSDEAVPKVVEHPTVEEKERGPGFGGIFTGLFKKGPAHLDYPVSSTYEGLVDETGRHRDIDGEPLDHHVSVYHSGRSDEAVPKVVEHPTVEEKERGPGFGGIFTGLFKKGPAHLDYPVSSTYEGLVDETGRHRDIDGEPLDHHVSVYHSGRSDEAGPKQPEHPTVEEKERGPGFGGIFTGLFKKGPAHLDYPVSSTYEGLVDETGRHRDIDGEPLDHHVSVYHSGRSDEPVPRCEHPTVEEKERGIPGFGGIFTGLFKKGPVIDLFKKGAAHLDYPSTGIYEGPLYETGRIGDVDGEPLDHHVSVYHTGRSDEPVVKLPEVAVPVVEEKERGPGFGTRFAGLFKKGAAHLDYPSTGIYEGPLYETGRIGDVDGEPLDHHVSVYHTGRSDEPVVKLPEVQLPPIVEEKERGPGFGTRFAGLFKKGAAHLDYPSTGIYEGPLYETGRIGDVDGEPLDHHVSVYHTGRSDEPVVKLPEVTVPVPLKRRNVDQALEPDFAGLFKKGAAHLDYPSTGIYEGPLYETGRIGDVDDPMSQRPRFTSIIHLSTSEKVITEKAQDIKTKVTSLFKKGAAHLDYPSTGIYEGPLYETGRIGDVDGEPLDHHVSVYHTGRSDEPVVKLPEVSARLLKRRNVAQASEPDSPVSSRRAPLISTTHPPESTKVRSMKLAALETSTVNLSITTSLSITLEDPTSQSSSCPKLQFPLLKRRNVDQASEPDSPVSSRRAPLISTTHRPESTKVRSMKLAALETWRLFPGRSDRRSVPKHPTVEEKERALVGGIFAGLLRRAPLISTTLHRIYEGPLYETGRIGDVTVNLSITTSLSITLEDPRASRQERGPGFGGIFAGLFKKGAAHLDYAPVYEGPLYETGALETSMVNLSITTSLFITLEDPTSQSAKLLGLALGTDSPVSSRRAPLISTTLHRIYEGFGTRFAGLFKKGAAHLDYPSTGIYEGPLYETGRIGDVDGEPLDHHVSVYHTGRSDEPVVKLPEVAVPVVEEKERGPGFGTRFAGLFKKGAAHLDYPSTGIYEGPLYETGRIGDVDGEPLDHHVSVYHTGRSDEPVVKLPEVAVPVVEEKERGPGFGTRFAGLFKKGAAHLDYPSTGIYEGPLYETGRIGDVDGEPLDHHVSVYHTGRSDEPAAKIHEHHPSVDFGEVITEKAQDIKTKVTSLFKKGAAHLDYPSTGIYEGPLYETGRIGDVDGEPLDHHVSVYHTGRSDEPVVKLPEVPVAIVEEKERGPGFGTRFAGLFKKGAAHLDYPSTGIYEGPLYETGRIGDVDGEPLDHHVSVYHTGRSDEPVVKLPEVPVAIVEEKERGPGFGTRFAGLFKKGAAHLDYPSTGIYEGPLYETGRIGDVDGEPLDHHVSVYHTGRSDEPVVKLPEVPVAIVEEKERGPGFGTRFAGLFKKGAAHLDYPSTGIYEGPLYETGRIGDVDDPTSQSSSFPKLQFPLLIEKERGPGFGTRFAGLFKKGAAHLDYPSTGIYEGPLYETGRIGDVDGEPLDHHVSVYHTGRSDEPAAKIHEHHPSVDFGEVITEKAQDIKTKVTSLFKKGAAHLDYPSTGIYEGPLYETGRIGDVDGEPLDHHVSVYHTGRSDEPAAKIHEHHPSVDFGEVITEKAQDIKTKVTSLFKKGAAHLDYPSTGIYEGPLYETGRIGDVDGEPLDHHVSVYHTGRSDEPVVKLPEVPVAIVEEKERGPGFGTRFAGLFKKGAAHLDYPSTGIYEGPLYETGRIGDVDGEPLDHHVSVYHTGRSDEPAAKIHEHHPSVDFGEVITEKAQDIKTKVTSLFKKGAAHLDYPSTGIYEGPLYETGRIGDVDGEPLDHHVSVYHTGRSDEPVVKLPEVPVAIVEEKERGPGFGTRFAGLFKKGAAHLDYPSTGIYEGPLYETGRIGDVDGEPLDHHVSVYHTGRSDEPVVKLPEVPVAIVEEKERGPGFGTRFAGLFKKGAAHLDYPSTGIYEGPLYETGRIGDVDGEPLDHHVSVYHTGRSDEPAAKIHEHHPSVDFGEVITEKAQDIKTKVTSLFKKGAAHLDYPSTGIYEGPLYETGRIGDVDGEPLDHHVSVYHTGRSDEPVVKLPEVPVAIVEEKERGPGFGTRFAGLFKKGAAHLDYPSTGIYEGPLYETGRIGDVDGEPLDHHVSVYHTGRSEEPVVKLSEVVVPVVEEKERAPFGARFSSLRRKEFAYKDYPLSTFDGLLHTTSPTPELLGEPLSYHVSVYHRHPSNDVPPPVPAHRSYDPYPTLKTDESPRDFWSPHEIVPSDPHSSLPPPLPIVPPPDYDYSSEGRSSAVTTIERKAEWRDEPKSPTSFTVTMKTKPAPHHVAEPVAERRPDVVALDYRRTRSSSPRKFHRVEQSTLNRSDHRIMSQSAIQSTEYSDRFVHRKPSWTSVSETTTVSYSKRITIKQKPNGRRNIFTEDVTIYNHGRPSTSFGSSPRPAWTTFEETTISSRPRNISPPKITSTPIRMRPISPPPHERSVAPLFYDSYTRSQKHRYSLEQPKSIPIVSTSPSQSQPSQERYRHEYGSAIRTQPLQLDNGGHGSNGLHHQHYQHHVHRRPREPVRVPYPSQKQRGNGVEPVLQYQRSNLHEIPIAEIVDQLPMIEDGAELCTTASHHHGRPIETRHLEPGSHDRPHRNAPLRRARRRIQNYCTML